MKERLKKLTSKGMLKRYLAMLLTIITVITTVPLSNLMSVSAGIKDRTFYFKFNPGGSDSYIADTWVFWDEDLTDIAEAEKYETVCKSAWLLIATWNTAHENYSESKDISWTKLSNNYYMANGDYYNATPFIRIIIDTPAGYHLKSVRDANGSKMAYYYDGGNTVVAECGLYVGDWTEVGNAESRPDKSVSNITLEWERDTYSMTMSWDSGVDYVSVDNYSSDYNYTTAGQSHDFGTGDTIITKAHLKSGYNMVGFQEGSKIWTDFSPKTKYQSEYSDSWTMDGNRSVKVITETTLSYEYDSGFENSAHTETVQTDTYYKDYPKLKKNYVIDYIEELGTDNKWYACDGRDSNGLYTNWSAYKPRKIKYHSKLKESAKKTYGGISHGEKTLYY